MVTDAIDVGERQAGVIERLTDHLGLEGATVHLELPGR